MTDLAGEISQQLIKKKPRRRIRKRKQRDLSLAKVRSALTNGSKLVFGDIAETAPWFRRLRDLRLAYENDLGGGDNLGEAQLTIAHQLAMLKLQLEMLEAKFAKQGGEAMPTQLDAYGRVCNSMRRLIETANIHRGRIARDITNEGQDIVERVLAKVEQGAST